MKFLKVLAVFLAAVPALARAPDLDVLDKAGDCVTAYERTFVGVVAEETFRQEAATVFELEFHEERGGTLIRTAGNPAMPSLRD